MGKTCQAAGNITGLGIVDFGFTAVMLEKYGYTGDMFLHGIYDEDVKDCPTFKQVAEGLKETLQGSDLAGFNSNKFDIPLLAEEFIRA